jgi:uncharacterized membrane protein YgdD (TMEM256/DUF423 family)
MNDEAHAKAKKRVQDLKAFYSNLATYVVINIVLIIINLVTSPHKLWFYWVTIFWGIGLLLHASKLFVFKGKFLGDDWEERKTRQLMEKEEKSRK